jgi:hypothetical protein
MALRVATWSLIAVLSGANIWLNGWVRGHKAGYGEAMADVNLGLRKPEDFFKEMLRSKSKWLGIGF